MTTRADLFSFGVLLYECLTGALPFSGSTTFDYVRHVMQSAPKRLDRVAPETPAVLVDLVERCLEKTPADRPESADEVVRQLRGLDGCAHVAGNIGAHRRPGPSGPPLDARRGRRRSGSPRSPSRGSSRFVATRLSPPGVTGHW